MFDGSNPFGIFQKWFLEAKACKEIKDATAFALGTSSTQLQPSVRIVLLKGFNENGFVFFTNKNSNKGFDIKNNPQVCACFYWDELGKQIRIWGSVKDCTDAESDSYFQSRPLGSQIGAIISKQSSVLEAGYSQLQDEYKNFNGDVIRPKHWGGFLILPHKMEFWQDMPYRLHKRDLFEKSENGWVSTILYP